MSEGIESLDRLFDSFVIGNASLEKLWTGARWAEGTFGGPERNRLFITATSSLYSIYLDREGSQRP